MTNNCSSDAHAVLDVFVVFVVLHSRRKVTTIEKEDTLVLTMVVVYDCKVWYFFGSTMHKGKKRE